MHTCFRPITALVAPALALAFTLASPRAHANDGGANPCGNFDFSAGINCKIEVSGGCTADCSLLKEELACAGGCSVTADTMCVNNCGTQCVAMCDPAHLDCFTGCHGECDGPTTQTCMQMNPQADCVNQAKAQCDVHCNDSCKIPPSNCQEHCNKCCTGSCTTQVNFMCDFSCFANVHGNCSVQCSKPDGAIFCNGSYVNASDIQACISYLATQGIMVDVSARASCDLSGCHGVSNIPGASGCAASPGTNVGLGAWAGGVLFVVGAGAFRARRRRGRR